MLKKKVAVVGYSGKMGQVICETIHEKYFIVGVGVGDDINIAKDAEVIIDFSTATNSVETAKWCHEHNKKLIIGATGHTDLEKKQIKNYSKNIPIVFDSNFSLGIVLLKRIALQILDNASCDVCLFEKHHNQKKDIPSGTALDIASLVEKSKNVKVNILSERGGKEIGTHELDFYFGDEVIRVTHSAFSRNCFAEGVLRSIEFLLNNDKNGLFSAEDIWKIL